MRLSKLFVCAIALFIATVSTSPVWAAGRGGELTLFVTDRDTGQPVACRMSLRNGRSVAQKPPKLPYWHDHFVFEGSLTLKLPSGNYTFEIGRGPEYLTRSGNFTINEFAEDTHDVDLKRIVDMSSEGWWSGDLDVVRPEKDLPLLMEADDLHVAEVFGAAAGKSAAKPSKTSKPAPSSSSIGAAGKASAWVSAPNSRYYHRLGQAEARSGNLLLFCGLNEALPLDVKSNDLAPLWTAAGEVHAQSEAWVDVARAFSWDLPLLVAEGSVDSIELANRHLAHDTTMGDEAGGKPRDKDRYAGVAGIGRWTENIYYHLLNCGLRIPPSAGSGSGEAPNPVGYNRMYVQVDGPFSPEKWREGLEAGRVVVTNGPLMRPKVEGEYPGHVFQVDAGQECELEIGLTLSTRETIDYIEVIRDGEAIYNVRLDEFVGKQGRIPPLKFRQSGWFLARAVTSANKTYRFASSGPYYVEVGERPRISLASARFFRDWAQERAKLLKGTAPAATLERYQAAIGFWQKLVEQANSK
jgi:hypothetical protein